jgi:hypothetical protein
LAGPGALGEDGRLGLECMLNQIPVKACSHRSHCEVNVGLGEELAVVRVVSRLRAAAPRDFERVPARGNGVATASKPGRSMG